MMLTARSTSGPIQSLTKTISLDKHSCVCFNMCFSERFWSCPLGLPRCDINTQAPPLLIMCSIVGFAAKILELSATFLWLSRGTLKSTLIKAFLFLKLMSVTNFICLKP